MYAPAMDASAGFEFRAPTKVDLDGVAEVLLADQLADGVEPTIDAHFLRGVWSRPDFDLATDAWVVIDAGRTIVAYGQVGPWDGNGVWSWGVVHPEQRGRGIGSALLDRIEERALTMLAGLPSARFRHSINAADRAAAVMLSDRGLQPIRHYWHMQVDLESPVETGPTPDGIDIGGIEPPDDLRDIHGILVAAFAQDPGDHPAQFDKWLEESTASPSYDPTMWLLARDAGAPVGALTASAGDDVGWVEWVGIIDSHRGRGIASALLRRAFAAFAGRGLLRVRLNVDAENATGATGVYERVGMRVVNRWDLWERRG